MSSRERAIPIRRGSSSGTASASSMRCTGAARRRSSCCLPGRSSTRATGRCRFLTWHGTVACSPSTGAVMAAPTGLRTRMRMTSRSSPPTRSRSWTRPAPMRRSSCPFRSGRSGRCCSRQSIPNVSMPRFSSARRMSVAASRWPSEPSTPGRRSSIRTRAGQSTTSTSGCATTAASWSSSSRACSPSRTQPSPSRTVSAGALRRPARRS